MGWRTQALKASEKIRNENDHVRRGALELAYAEYYKWRDEFERAKAEGEDQDYIDDAEFTFILAAIGVKWGQEQVANRIPVHTKIPAYYTDCIPQRLQGRTALWLGEHLDRPVVSLESLL